jgi:hypothetical protein
MEAPTTFSPSGKKTRPRSTPIGTTRILLPATVLIQDIPRVVEIAMLEWKIRRSNGLTTGRAGTGIVTAAVGIQTRIQATDVADMDASKCVRNFLLTCSYYLLFTDLHNLEWYEVMYMFIPRALGIP